MKIGVIGSRKLDVDIGKYIPKGITCLVSGGAKGIDTLAEKWADENNIPKIIFKPNYDKYGRGAPLIRNRKIVREADLIVAIWDGKSRGTKYTVDYANESGKKVELHILKPSEK